MAGPRGSPPDKRAKEEVCAWHIFSMEWKGHAVRLRMDRPLGYTGILKCESSRGVTRRGQVYLSGRHTRGLTCTGGK